MRYEIVEGSQTGHCCFVATIIDTYTNRNLYPKDLEHNALCECMDVDDAQKICAALNATVQD